MGPNGSGKAPLTVIAGHEDYEVENGSIVFDGEDLADLDAEERAHKGIFVFSISVEIPGVTVTNFIKTAIMHRKAQGLEDMPANEMQKNS